MLTGTKVIAMASLTIMMCAACFAADANAPAAPAEKPVKIQGMVTVVKDANNVVTSITVKAKDMVYSVEMDKKGMELAGMAGKEVEITGVVMKKDGKDMVKVLSAKPVEKAEKAEKSEK